MNLRNLGARLPTDWAHVEKYGLTAATAPTKPVPVCLAISWYSAFDRPELVGGRYHIGRARDWGAARGRHAVCLKPAGLTDAAAWWSYFNQGTEFACVGFAASRMMTLLNRWRYDARWLYHRAQQVDEWPGESYDGTSLRAGLDVLRNEGHRRVVKGNSTPVDPQAGISANRWALDVDEIVRALGYSPFRNELPILNSWGRAWPHMVHIGTDALDRLLQEDGEASIVTDH